MAALPRIPEGGTGIGSGIAMAIRKLDRNGLEAPRQVVDVSGDGRETPARENVVMMPMANAMARARGVTVNGLAILNEDSGLAGWYRDNVIAGREASCMTAADYSRFRRGDRDEAHPRDRAPGTADACAKPQPPPFAVMLGSPSILHRVSSRFAAKRQDQDRMTTDRASSRDRDRFPSAQKERMICQLFSSDKRIEGRFGERHKICLSRRASGAPLPPRGGSVSAL